MSSTLINALRPTLADAPHAPPTDEESIYYSGRPLLGGKTEKVLGLISLGAFFYLVPIIFRIWKGMWLTDAYSGGTGTCMTVVLLVVGGLLLAVAAIIIKSTNYRISNYRIDFERGMLGKDISTLELWHVEDISLHQSIFDRILGIGTIRVMAHDENMPDLQMRGLPNARKIFEELKQRIIAVKRQAGVMKLDTGN
jgi:uncharacterized membrane protein YdbT with pleckstrin-like domain